MAKKVSKTIESTTKSANIAPTKPEKVSKIKAEQTTNANAINLFDVIEDIFFKNLGVVEVMQKYRIDTQIQQIELGPNIVLESSFWRKHGIGFKNQYANVDGKPLYNNSVLVKRIKKIWNTGLKEIDGYDIFKLGFFIPADELKISDNIYLNKTKKESFIISLIDPLKDIDGKWLDHAVTIEKVKIVLSNYDYNKTRLTLAEVPLNEDLVAYLKEHFVSVKKSAPCDGGYLDVLIGKVKTGVAIELKLSREVIKTGAISRAVRGQLEDYSDEYGSNLLVVIAGIKSEKNHDRVQAIKQKTEKLNASYVFIDVD